MRAQPTRPRGSAAFFAGVTTLLAASCSGDTVSERRMDGGTDAATDTGASTPVPHPDAAAPAHDAHTHDAPHSALDAGMDAARDGASNARDAHAADAEPVAPNEGGATDARADASRARSLWNGVDLSEWDGDPMIWNVVDGAIVGKAPSGYLTVNSFLIYRGDVPADFALAADAWLGMNGNSGIQYRSARFDTMGYRIRGYQVDMGLNYWGQLAEEAGRGILQPPSAACLSEGAFGKWLRYEVRAVGPNLDHHIEGIECVSYVDTAANRPSTGVVALQYHVPGGFEVRFKNLRLEPL
jgi:hypothetical protein